MAQVGALPANRTRGRLQGSAVAAMLRPIVGGLAILVALIGLIGSAIRDPQPHDIPVGLVGPAPAVQQLSDGFAGRAPGTFTFTTYTDEGSARAALDARTVDGVVVLGRSPKVIVAGAAGDATAGVITGAFANAFKAQGAQASVETVHPFTSGDAHGLVLFFLMVAVMASTLAAAALLSGAAVGLAGRVTGLAVYAGLAGAVGMATAQWITGAYANGFWSAAGLLALGSAVIGTVVAGSGRIAGAPGIGLAGLVVVLLDLVASGGPVGSRMLPDFYRWLAPWMPAPQLYSGLRGALYFDGAAMGRVLAVLGGWLVLGALLLVAGELAAQRRAAPVA